MSPITFISVPLSLPKAQQDGLLLHELLHAALLHITRRGHREANLWNLAADIVVNGLIIEQGLFELPEGGIRKPEWEKMSVEEIYDLLLKKSPNLKLPNPDLLSQPPEDCKGNSSSNSQNSEQENDSSNSSSQNKKDDNKNNNDEIDSLNGSENSQDSEKEDNKNNSSSENKQKNNNTKSNQFGSLTQAEKEKLASHWRNAMQQATLIQRTKNQGKLPAEIERKLEEISQSQIDWRSYLWRYLVQTPNDFRGYDRRFVGRGLYLVICVYNE